LTAKPDSGKPNQAGVPETGPASLRADQSESRLHIAGWSRGFLLIVGVDFKVMKHTLNPKQQHREI
jgi:hypothetical protein